MAPKLNTLSATNGKTGDPLTINGTGLSSVNKVYFGNKSISSGFTATSTTVSITAIPNGCAGLSNISVVAAGVSSNSLPFIYVASPECTYLTPESGDATPGTIDIFGSGFATATAVTFGTLTPAATPTVVSDTHLTVTPTAHGAFAECTDTVDVVVTGSGGDSTACLFTYYNAPTVTNSLPATGGVGTTGIIVTGTCFVDVSEVLFDGATDFVATDFTVNDLTELVINTLPAGITADTYDIRVTTPGGQSALNAPVDQFVVTA